MRIFLGHAVLLLLFIGFDSCKRKVIPAEQIATGEDYFPLELGHYVEYEVDSFLYNDFNLRIDTFHYEIRDEVSDTFYDSENRLSHIITRYKRYESSEPWSEELTYYVTKNSYRTELVENNLRFIKLVFPIRDNMKWYGNSYIPTQLSEFQWMSNWYYTYDRISLPFTNGKLIFQDAVVVNQNDYANGNPDTAPNDYASKIFSREAYAKQIGLVYREVENWVYQPTVKYRSGFKIVYKAVKYN
jgi:hypothetical protein